MNEKWNAFTKNMFKVGTAECAIFFAVVAMVLALMFLIAGFWETLLIAALIAVGAFVGGVKDKKEWIRNAVNGLFPAKQPAYQEKHEEIVKAVHEVLENKEEKDD